MFRFTARTKLAFGLTSLMSTVLMASLVLGLLPDPTSERLDSRGKLCTAIAVSSSMLLNTEDRRAVREMLTQIVKMDDEVLSAAIRCADGELLPVGNHKQLWAPQTDGEKSTDTHVFVPLYQSADTKFGNVEIRFSSLQPEGLMGWLTHPMVRLAAFVGSACFLLFFFYLGKTLEHLDPSQAVPSRVRSALDTLAESLLVIDESSRIMLTNSAFEKLTGKTATETMGLPIAELDWLDPEEMERPDTFPWTETLETSVAKSNTMLRLRLDKSVHSFVVNCSPVLGHEDDLRGVLITLEDVTQLEEKKQEALAATEAKSLFLANMSHEIRTPMNAIIGFTDVLRRGIETDEAKQREYLDTIHSSGHHLIGLINDILDLSKIESGKLEIEKRDASPHAMMLDVANVMHFKAQEMGLELNVLTDGRIPETIVTDPTRLRQVLMNLLSNAVKFTEKGSVTVIARLDKGESGTLLAFDVTDTGIGIRPDRIDQIFSPFVQADNTVTRRFGGTGLGLAISRQLATALGGELTASSVYGEGTTFTVTIDPGAIENVEHLTMEEARPRLASTSTTSQKHTYKLPPARVLLADDGEANRQLASLLLTRAGLTVQEVENGADALAKAMSEDFDLILMDMQMPVMDGWSATRALRQRGYEKPIIALTAAAMVEDAQRCFDAGCDDFLTKPIELDRLMSAIGKALKVEPEVVDAGTPVELAVSAGPEPALLAKSAATQPTPAAEGVSTAPAVTAAVPPIAPLPKPTSQAGVPAVVAVSQPMQPQPVERQPVTAESPLTESPIGSGSNLEPPSKHPPAVEITTPAVSAGPELRPVAGPPIISTLPTEDPEFRQIVVGFVEKLHSEMAGIRAAVAAQDWDELGRKAHWLKGSAGTMGFHEMTEPALKLEQDAKSADANGVSSSMAVIEGIVDRIVVPGETLVGT
jgi:PAS domain S-box-containing protein